MLKFVEGDFFDFDADIRVNTVNCVGVMGKGVALVFKQKYPDMYKQYVKDCKSKDLTPGKPTVWHEKDFFQKDLEIINFPTKNDWKDPSKYEYIEDGLKWLQNYLSGKNDLVVTLPALGCGHGGLDWNIVKKLILHYLSESPSNILVFEPHTSKVTEESNYLDKTSLDQLCDLGIEVLSITSDKYPERLKSHTEKKLFVFNSENNSLIFDFALISSTKPSPEENHAIASFIEKCSEDGQSILFGGTSNDSNSLSLALNKSIRSGQFLPSGISAITKKFESNFYANVVVLSTGDPYKAFDKSLFLPSTIHRMLCSNNVIFTTTNLSWFKKSINLFLNDSVSFYFIESLKYDAESLEILDKLNAKPFDIDLKI